eukprot:scaffold45850_cov42-Prasinocladus_malaysianus.AAC.2
MPGGRGLSKRSSALCLSDDALLIESITGVVAMARRSQQNVYECNITLLSSYQNDSHDDMCRPDKCAN